MSPRKGIGKREGMRESRDPQPGVSSAPETRPAAGYTAVRHNGPEPRQLPDLVYHLWFAQFQQISWLSTAAAGAVLTLVQSGLLRLSIGTGLSLGAFAFSAVIAVLGPLNLPDGILKAVDVSRRVRLSIAVAVLLFGIGVGSLATDVIFRVLIRK